MVKYFIHLFTAIVLCTTTWIAVYPAASEEGGPVFGILACAFTTFIEYLGYISYRVYEKDRSNKPYFWFSMIILLSSGTLTFWGAGILEIWMTGSKVDNINEQIAIKNETAKSDYTLQLKAYNYRKNNFQSDKLEKIKRLEERRDLEIRTKSDSKYFSDHYLSGNSASFRRHKSQTVRARVDTADNIWNKFKAEIDAVELEKFTEPRPLYTEPDISYLKGKEERVVRQASTYANSIRLFDIVMCICAIFIAVSSKNTEKSYTPRHSISEGILNKMISIKEALGARLQVDESEYYSEREKEEIYIKARLEAEKEVQEAREEREKVERELLREKSERRAREIEREEREANERAVREAREIERRKSERDVEGIEFEGSVYKNYKSWQGSMRKMKSDYKKLHEALNSKQYSDIERADMKRKMLSLRSKFERMKKYDDELKSGRYY